MGEITFVDWIGYAASFFVFVSFVMKDMVKLRIVNIIGCSFFIAYGYYLDISWPIIITNAGIVLVNLYYLLQSKKA